MTAPYGGRDSDTLCVADPRAVHALLLCQHIFPDAPATWGANSKSNPAMREGCVLSYLLTIDPDGGRRMFLHFAGLQYETALDDNVDDVTDREHSVDTWVQCDQSLDKRRSSG